MLSNALSHVPFNKVIGILIPSGKWIAIKRRKVEGKSVKGIAKSRGDKQVVARANDIKKSKGLIINNEIESCEVDVALHCSCQKKGMIFG